MYVPKKPAWIPYLQDAKVIKKDLIHIKYNGGEINIKPSKTLSLLIYGDVDSLKFDVIEEFAKFNVPIVFHRRNVGKSIFISSGNFYGKDDLLTKQLLKRNDKRSAKYISRMLVESKLKNYKLVIPNLVYPKIEGKTLSEIRNFEAVYTKLFWNEFSNYLKIKDFNRRSNNPISNALNACSKFLAGIILRWINYHHLSPYHGYLHSSTTYPGLVYDLIEPYRYFNILAVTTAYLETKSTDVNKLTAVSIGNLKDVLNQEIYCVQTKQILRRQQLLHGICLSLRAYLLGLGKRFIIPTEGERTRGRKIKTNFTIPGKDAGYSKLYKKGYEII